MKNKYQQTIEHREKKQKKTVKNLTIFNFLVEKGKEMADERELRQCNRCGRVSDGGEM